MIVLRARVQTCIPRLFNATVVWSTCPTFVNPQPLALLADKLFDKLVEEEGSSRREREWSGGKLTDIDDVDGRTDGRTHWRREEERERGRRREREGAAEQTEERKKEVCLLLLHVVVGAHLRVDVVDLHRREEREDILGDTTLFLTGLWLPSLSPLHCLSFLPSFPLLLFLSFHRSLLPSF